MKSSLFTEYTMDGYHFHTQYNSNGQAGQAQPAYQVAHQNPRYQGNVPGRGSNFSMNPAASKFEYHTLFSRTIFLHLTGI